MQLVAKRDLVDLRGLKVARFPYTNTWWGDTGFESREGHWLPSRTE